VLGSPRQGEVLGPSFWAAVLIVNDLPSDRHNPRPVVTPTALS
jgi:hypothetical protein